MGRPITRGEKRGTIGILDLAPVGIFWVNKIFGRLSYELPYRLALRDSETRVHYFQSMSTCSDPWGFRHMVQKVNLSNLEQCRNRDVSRPLKKEEQKFIADIGSTDDLKSHKIR